VDGYEVLGHAEGEIDFSRMKDGLVIQDTHWGDQIGIMRNPEVKDGKLTGVIEFGCGERAQEIKRDAIAGIRRNMSVGYIVTELKEDGEAEDGLPIFRAVKWMPYEASFVNVPADTCVGVGRSHEPTAAKPAAVNKESKKMEPEETKKAETPAGVTADEVRGIVTEAVSALREEISKKPEVPAPANRGVVFDEGERRQIERQYNLCAVIRALAGEKVDVGFERELSEQIAKATKKEARGLFIPEAAFRTLTGVTNVDSHITGNGAATVATNLLAGSYIDALVARTVLGAAGVTTLSGLTGDIAIPKGGTATAGWLTAEDGDATVASPAFSQINGTPHTISSNVDISRKLVLQSSLSVQAIITGLILDAIARGIEAAAFDGTGSSGQPTGVSATAGINSVSSLTAGAPTHDALVDFWEKIYTANAAGASMKFIGSPAVKALLCKTRDILPFNNTGARANSSVVGAVGGEFLCTKDGTVEGYEFLMSGLCNAKKLYFGDWSQLILAFWSGVDLTVDPYSLSTKGALRLVAFQDCDVLVRHPQAFAIGTAIS
jgi:HK97 family phage major capsid protein